MLWQYQIFGNDKGIIRCKIQDFIFVYSTDFMSSYFLKHKLFSTSQGTFWKLQRLQNILEMRILCDWMLLCFTAKLEMGGSWYVVIWRRICRVWKTCLPRGTSRGKKHMNFHPNYMFSPRKQAMKPCTVKSKIFCPHLNKCLLRPVLL